jgi:alpha-tubulin suppressor-like RCC1 family protein
VPKAIARSGPFAAVSLGQGHVCALRESGELYCWGRNTTGQLGIGSEQVQVRPPTLVTAGTKYRAITAAMSHSCAIRQDGHLFCWGNNLDGLLGAGSNSGKHYTPVQVGEATDHLDVQNNWFHTCTVREGGRLWCWGRNAEGQLGLGDTAPRSRPQQLRGEGFGRLAVGQFHSCAERAGSLYCWGKNEEGELGIGLVGRKDVPTRVRLP